MSLPLCQVPNIDTPYPYNMKQQHRKKQDLATDLHFTLFYIGVTWLILKFS